jgi:glycosyltransferase involved in cell wall biosynthesis
MLPGAQTLINLAADPLILAPDGTDFALTSPGALLVGPPQAPEAHAVIGASSQAQPRAGAVDAPSQARPNVVVLDAAGVHSPPSGAALYVVRPGALPSEGRLTTLKALKRKLAPALLAGPASTEGPFDSSPVDIVLMTADPDPTACAWSALRAGVRAAGRPVLVLVEDRVPADSVVAAFDAGAAGAVFAADGGAADATLLAEVAERERHRLDDAPLITVAVCNRNGARDLEECFASLATIGYPSFETLLVDDGSTDDSLVVAARFGVRAVALEPVGLGGARNAAIEHARGEILAYLDGDAQADPAWLGRLWRLHDRLRPGGVGGPNLPVADPSWQERAIGGAPGVAMPIVRADGRCTHLAGCNMSFRIDVAREALFDPHVVYGDDVEFCFRVLDLGEDLLLHPTATIRHHRRRSLVGYVKQMHQYGRWGTLMESRHGGRLVDVDTEPSVLERLDPRRPHHCFVGPQAAQRYNLSFAPLSNGFPFKVMALTVIASAAMGPPARRAGRLRGWAALAVAGVVGQFGYVAVRTPVQKGIGGPRALTNRLLTAALWYLGPGSVAAGRLRAYQEHSDSDSVAGDAREES